MVNITVAVPDELRALMQKFPEMNWSEVARQAWKNKAEQLALLNRFTAKSKATDEDIMEISRKIKAGMARWHEQHKA